MPTFVNRLTEMDISRYLPLKWLLTKVGHSKDDASRNQLTKGGTPTWQVYRNTSTKILHNFFHIKSDKDELYIKIVEINVICDFQVEKFLI